VPAAADGPGVTLSYPSGDPADPAAPARARRLAGPRSGPCRERGARRG